jgi:hypothetical protein
MMEDEWGRARVRQQGVDGVDRLQEAIDTCPVSCIHWVSPTVLQPSALARHLEMNFPCKCNRQQRFEFPCALHHMSMSMLQVTAPQLALLEETMSRMERVAAFVLVRIWSGVRAWAVCMTGKDSNVINA